MTDMTNNQLQALQMFQTATRGRYDVYTVAGPQNARLRASLMTLLKGAKVPQSVSGINALRDAFWSLADGLEGCIAHKEDAFKVWADQQLATLPTPTWDNGFVTLS